MKSKIFGLLLTLLICQNSFCKDYTEINFNEICEKHHKSEGNSKLINSSKRIECFEIYKLRYSKKGIFYNNIFEKPFFNISFKNKEYYWNLILFLISYEKENLFKKQYKDVIKGIVKNDYGYSVKFNLKKEMELQGFETIKEMGKYHHINMEIFSDYIPSKLESGDLLDKLAFEEIFGIDIVPEKITPEIKVKISEKAEKKLTAFKIIYDVK